MHGTKRADRLLTVNGVRDTVSCGGGHDLVTVDLLDRVARDCEVVSRQISRDPYTNSLSRHESEVEPSAFGFGRTVVAAFQVGRVFDGGARNIGFAVSRDSGRTWKHGFFRGFDPRPSDPVVTYDRRHGVWLAVALVLQTRGSSVRVSRSRDGLRWGRPVTAVDTSAFGQDKEWIACDNWPQSPFFGRCYLSYSDTINEEVVVQASADGGLSWSAPATAPGFPGRASIRGAYAPGVQPVVLPSGRALVPYYDEGRISTLRSDDGGSTWTAQLAIAPADYRPHRGVRAAPLPSGVVGADGRAYLAWADCSFRPGCAANDVVVVSTADGLSWTAPARIPTGGGDTELPGLGADPARPGRLGLVSYTLRGASLDVRFVSTSDGGAHWTRPQPLSSRPVRLPWIAPTSQGSMVGDYMATAFAGARAVPVFVLATKPTRGRLHEAAFATSLPVP